MVNLVMRFSADCWVEVTDSNGRLIFGLQEAGSEASASAKLPVSLLLGNAAGVTLEVAGLGWEHPAKQPWSQQDSAVPNRFRRPGGCQSRTTMSAKISGIRGMSDVLPEQTHVWQQVEAILRRVVTAYGYRELRVPVVERTELFKRSIGEVTDIVEKEMYTFADRNDESLTLRPEATAGIVRAGIAHGLFHNQKQKLWSAGPMFRYEKPQKGRYRQFHQFDVEAFGYPGPDIDAELLLIIARIWRELGLEPRSGWSSIRSARRPRGRAIVAELLDYFSAHRDRLDEESLARLERNPLRLLDSKNPELQELMDAAPRITDHLDQESAEHFAAIQEALSAAGIAFEVNTRLVRGLDYYTRTVFEWVTDQLGAQGAVCSGGRYDGLVEHLGGRPTPAIGWAIGLERLVELYQTLR